jgi:uncharacterized protein (TIGR02145 family)
MKLLAQQRLALLFAAAITVVAGVQTAWAQTVAVYVFGADAPPALNKALTTHLITALSNTGRYRAAGNYREFFKAAAEEHGAGASPVYSGQIMSLGQRFGVDYVCVAEIASVLGEKYVSARLFDAKTAGIVAEGAGSVPLRAQADLPAASGQLVGDMFKGAAQPAYAQTPAPAYAPTPIANAASVATAGKGIRLAVLEPAGRGLSADEQWMLSLVQGSITGDFNKYSGMTIIDRQNLENILKEWEESMSGNYSEATIVKIGNLTGASHILSGSITKTANAFMLELAVTDAASGERKASYPPTPVSPLALENLSAIKTASADLMRQLGVKLTGAALGELQQAANTSRIQAEAALARGIAAQKRGTEVAALSYFYQAAALDPSLFEASTRSSIMAANISSGNIGADIRNDIAWRKKWVAKLTETEEIFYRMIKAAGPPYTLYYSTDIKTGEINYERETAELNIITDLSANYVWFKTLNRTLQAAQAVLDGLNSTNRKKDWKLAEWPERGVSETNPFKSRYDSYNDCGSYFIDVVFELVNQQGRVIGSQKIELKMYFGFSTNEQNRIKVEFTANELNTIRFKNVRASDISDNLTIRVASVNDKLPQKARFSITAMPLEKPSPLVDSRDGKRYNAVRIGSKVWMSENLNYLPQTGNSWCYNNDNSNCAKYGRLYDKNTAQNVCPAGWHLPTSNEWQNLFEVVGGIIKYTGGTRFGETQELEIRRVGNQLRTTRGWNDYNGKNGNGNDDYGFSALSGGSRDSKGSFGKVGESGNWWMAEKSREYCGHDYRNRDYVCESDSISWSWTIDNYFTTARARDNTNVKSGLSVRCVQDDGYNIKPSVWISEEPAPVTAATVATDTTSTTATATTPQPAPPQIPAISDISSVKTSSGSTPTDNGAGAVPAAASIKNRDVVTYVGKDGKTYNLDSSVAAALKSVEPAERKRKRQNHRGFGFGGYFASDFGGGVTWDDESEREVKLAMPYYGGGFYMSLDFIYLEPYIGFSFGNGTWKSAAFIPDSLPEMSRTCLNFGALVKFPLINIGRHVTLFPLYGVDYEASVSDTSVTATLKYPNGYEYKFDGENGRPSAGALSSLWYKYGGGIEVGVEEGGFRLEVLYGVRQNANRFESDYAEKKNREGRDGARALPGYGWTVRLGMNITMAAF